MNEGQAPLNRFEYKPLAMFLCQYHRVSDVRFIDPWVDPQTGQRMMPAYELARKTVLGVDVGVSERQQQTQQNQQTQSWKHGTPITCMLQPHMLRNSPQPKDPFVHPVKKQTMEHDVNDQGVCVYGITCPRYWLTKQQETDAYRLKCAVRLTFFNEHMARVQQTKVHYKMQAAAGAEERGFAVLTETPAEGRDTFELPMPELGFGLQNEHYTKTMMLVNEANLLRGVICIPHEVCVAARLPVFTGQMPVPDERMLEKLMASMKMDPSTEEGKRGKQDLLQQFQQDAEESYKGWEQSEYFYAVPTDHVMAWSYASEGYTDMHEFRVEKFRFIHADTKQPVLLYYLVPGKPFERSIGYFKDSLLGKVDRRPLQQIGFEFIPRITDEEQQEQAVRECRMRAYISYYSVPCGLSQETINRLAPRLCPDYPLAHNWSEDEVARQIALEEAALEQKTKKFNK